MSVYVGIDVHRKRSQLAVIDASGEVLTNRNVPNGVEPILKVIGGLPAGTPAAFEAAFGTGWLVELLEGYGFGPHLVHPSRCKAIASARLKNDKGRRGDPGAAAARGPAPGGVDRAAGGPPAAGAAAAPGPAGPAADAAAQPRSTPCWPTTVTAVPPGAGGGPGREWTASLELPAASREVVDDGLALTGALEIPVGRLGCEIRQRARSDPRVEVLTQLPGVGPFTALVILAETGDVSRFASARKLASWAGLTPAVRGSGRVAHYGHISKQGPAWLRWVLCEAAQTARRSPEFADAFQAIARRRGKKIATTAAARKLLTRAWHLLTDAGLAVPQPAPAPASETRRR